MLPAAAIGPSHGLRWLRLVLVAACVLPVIALGAIAWVGWRDTWDGARRELVRSAEAAGEYALRVTEGHRLLTDLVNDLLRGLTDEEIRAREGELHAALLALLPRVPLVRTITVTDRSGQPLVMATVFPVPREFSLADREWHRVHAGPDSPPLHVSRVYMGRLDLGVFYTIGRRRIGTGNAVPRGAFDGVITVSVDPNLLAAGFMAVSGEGEDVTALVRADGEILVRTPGFDHALPQIPAGSPLRAAAQRGEARGVYMGTTLGRGPDPPGATRLIAFRRVGDLPLYVTVARPTPLIEARWQETLTRQFAVGLPTALALIGLAWLALRRAREADAAATALREAAAARAVAEARRAAEARFRGVFESRVVGMAVFDTTTGQTLLANDRLLEMTGASRAVFEGGAWDWRRVTPPDHLVLDETAIATARERGWWDPYEKDYVLPDGSRLPVRISSAPLPGEPGRVVVLVEDITERREAELRRELLMREVDHRAKNALATARAALRLTRAPTLAAFVREVDGRIGALAKAIALLAGTRWEGVDLETLLRSELLPFTGEDAAPTVTLQGPAVMIAGSAVQPLAMAMHELATNATKYGALSCADGMVTVSWAVDAGPARRLRLVWQERGGPPLRSVPDGNGFGTRVLQATLARQLGGAVTQHWEEAGLICEITLPAGRVLAPGVEAAAA